jgi:hypothetical protein
VVFGVDRMRAEDQPRVRLAICVDSPDLDEALARAVERTDLFAIVGRARNISELAGVVHTDLPDALLIDDRLGAGDVEAMLARVTVGRPLKTLVVVTDEATEKRRTRESPGLFFIAISTVLAKGLAAKSHVSHQLHVLAEGCGSKRHTIPTDILVETVERRQTLAGQVGVREEVVTLGTWPLDLIVLVGGAGNDELLADLVSRTTVLPVPVLVALRPYAAVEPRLWANARVPVRHVVDVLPLREAEGFLVAPRTGAVSLSPDALRGVPGSEPLQIVDLVRSTGALQSGALTVLLSDAENDAALALGAALDAGAVGAVLDPSACPRSTGPQTALRWGSKLVTLSPAELQWLLANAVPRRT